MAPRPEIRIPTFNSPVPEVPEDPQPKTRDEERKARLKGPTALWNDFGSLFRGLPQLSDHLLQPATATGEATTSTSAAHLEGARERLASQSPSKAATPRRVVEEEERNVEVQRREESAEREGVAATVLVPVPESHQSTGKSKGKEKGKEKGKGKRKAQDEPDEERPLSNPKSTSSARSSKKKSSPEIIPESPTSAESPQRNLVNQPHLFDSESASSSVKKSRGIIPESPEPAVDEPFEMEEGDTAIHSQLPNGEEEQEVEEYPLASSSTLPAPRRPKEKVNEKEKTSSSKPPSSKKAPSTLKSTIQKKKRPALVIEEEEEEEEDEVVQESEVDDSPPVAGPSKIAHDQRQVLHSPAPSTR
ncbi:hypothetical protein P7C70_g8737, partial [Phenoliferia sp. Uapishka_3]